MRKILMVKTSSLGDVVHNFPTISDIRRHLPDSQIDWVVEEAYLPLVAMHPGVHRAIPVAIRRWRKRLLSMPTWREVNAFRHQIRVNQYDAVIDTQGLIKSAMLSAMSHGPRHGFDASSAREPMAARFYKFRHRVSTSLHAVVRNRMLAAESLGYAIDEEVDYGLKQDGSSLARGIDPMIVAPMIVLLHSTSRVDKHWPETRWVELAGLIAAAGGRVVLPWGNEDERRRSERISERANNAEVPGLMSLPAMAELLANSDGVAGVDTGLTHLAAAMGKPVAAIYCATDPSLTGVYGATQARNLGGPGLTPNSDQVFEFLKGSGAL